MTDGHTPPLAALEVTSLYSPDLAPVDENRRTWGTWNLAAVWVGMATSIPTYVLASYMIKSGLSWLEALTIILFANIIVTVPMTLNGHAGVKYGVPFAVLGRAAFGTIGVHVPALARIRHQLPAADADALAPRGRAPSGRLDALATKVGDGCGLVGYFVTCLQWLYTASWFSGFVVSFLVYAALSRDATKEDTNPHVTIDS